MVLIKALTDDQLTEKMSVLHCLMMSHGGDLLARYRGLLKSHHDFAQSADSRLKSLQERYATFQGLESQVSGFQKQVVDLNGKLSSSDAALNQATVLKAGKDAEILQLKASPLEFASLFGLKEELAVVLNKVSRLVPGVQGRLAKAYPLVASTAYPLVASTDYPFLNKVSDHVAHPLSVILQLEPKKLAHLGGVLAPKDTRFSPPIAKESTVAPVSSSLELPSNDDPFSSVAALRQNEEWVNAMVDMPDSKMANGVVNDKLGYIFMQGVSHTIGEDVGSSLAYGPERASFGPNDVVVALSIGEKDNGSLSSPSAAEEDVASPSRV
ncbi:hypothetical protein Tco_1531311 [Tanacetum coccineum]